MSKWLAGALALLIGTSSAVAAPAPPPAPDQSATPLEEVVVVAPRDDMIESFVENVTAATSNRRLARWEKVLCPGVIGLRTKPARYMLNTLATTALRLGVRVGNPGCKPNALIVVATDAQAFTRDLVKTHPRVFNASGYEGPVTRGKAALKDFEETPRPVRWWHMAETVSADTGKPIEDGQLKVRSMSRIGENVTDDFAYLIVVIDAKTAGQGVSLKALSAYVTMIVLAQIKPDADPGGVPSILNLFHDRDLGLTPPPGLTDWDWAYLKGLYAANRAKKSRRAPRHEVRDKMKDELAKDPVK